MDFPPLGILFQSKTEQLHFLQMLGMHGTVFANFAVDQSDLLLAFGVRFDDRVTGKLETFAPHAQIVHIDIDPAELNKNKESFVTVSGGVSSSFQLCFWSRAQLQKD